MRMPETFLTGGIADNQPAPQIDLRIGAQNGLAPVLTQLQNSQAHVRRPIQGLTMTFPKGFEYTSDPEWWGSTLRALMEIHPKRISGLTSTLQVGYVETQVSNGGEVHHDWNEVTRDRSEPNFEWVDKYGMPIGNFWEHFILMFIGDPDTRIPGISMMDGVEMTDQLSDMHSFSMLFWEPDPTGRQVIRAWLCANMSPKTSGDLVGDKEIGGSMNQVEHSIPFTATTQHGLGPKMLAQQILNQINFVNANPQFAPAFLSGISADVAAVGGGWVGGIEESAAEALSTSI